jgi:hypothetical protein
MKALRIGDGDAGATQGTGKSPQQLQVGKVTHFLPFLKAEANPGLFSRRLHPSFRSNVLEG